MGRADTQETEFTCDYAGCEETVTTTTKQVGDGWSEVRTSNGARKHLCSTHAPDFGE